MGEQSANLTLLLNCLGQMYLLFKQVRNNKLVHQSTAFC